MKMFVLAGVVLLFAGCSTQQSSDKKQTSPPEVKPASPANAAPAIQDVAAVRHSPSLESTLDIPKLVVGVPASEGQIQRCNKALAAAKKYKNLPDDTQNRLQMCSQAILERVRLGLEVADQKAHLLQQEYERKRLMEQLNQIDYSLAEKACERSSGDEHEKCMQNALKKGSEGTP